MSLILRLLAMLVAALVAVPASAECVISGSSATFASSGSYAVRGGTVAQVNAGAGFACGGSLISLLGSNFARARMTSANGFRLSNANGDRIGYDVSADRAGAFSFSKRGTIDYFDSALLTILDGGSFNPRLYAQVIGGTNVAAGTYTDTLTIEWSWNICHGVGIGGICILSERGTGTSVIAVSIVVTNDCRIDAPSVSFGTASLVSQFAQVTQAIMADCTKGTAYAVRLTSGGHGTARPWRAMRDARGNNLRYNLYRSDGTTIWDESNPQGSESPGTGGDVPITPFVYRAQIDPNQPTPPVGLYSDVVSVLISF